MRSPGTTFGVVDTGLAVIVEHLHMHYGTQHAVDDLSFQVRRGRDLRVLGPNGAGKTTTVEILEGHRRRTLVAGSTGT